MATIIKDGKNDNNHFVISLNPSLGQVSFKGIEYRVNGSEIIAILPVYLFPMAELVFIKQEKGSK